MSSSSVPPPKPMRPLTAYHIFFQLEREYIIQNLAGPDADENIHDGKSRLPDVPRRYRATMLLPNWYAGPGKRRKRKHRKSHGKIAFLELSRLVSERWATLDRIDPETKRFVSVIAARELAEYKAEMKQYKELTKGADATEKPTATPAVKAKAKRQRKSPATPAAAAPITSMVTSAATPPAKEVRAVVSPPSSPRHSPSFGPEDMDTETSHHVPAFQFCQPVKCEPMEPLSLGRIISESPSSSDEGEEVDYAICSLSRDGHYVPCAGPMTTSGAMHTSSDGNLCDPLFELERLNAKRDKRAAERRRARRASCRRPTYERCVSPLLRGDVIDDDYLLRLACA